MMREEGGGAQALVAAGRDDGGARNVSPASSSSCSSISFSRLVKNFTRRNFIFAPHPSPLFARHGTAGLPYPGSRRILMSP